MSECLSTGGGEVVRAGGWVGGIIVTSVSGQSKLVLSLPKAVPRHSGLCFREPPPAASEQQFACRCRWETAQRERSDSASPPCVFSPQTVCRTKCACQLPQRSLWPEWHVSNNRHLCFCATLCNEPVDSSVVPSVPRDCGRSWEMKEQLFVWNSAQVIFFFLCLFVYFKWWNITALLFVHRTLILSI